MPDLTPIVVFPNEGEGFGDGITTRGFGGKSLPEGYDRTINMSVGGGDLLSPAFAAVLRGSVASRYPPAFIASWQDTSGIPFAIVAINNETRLVKNNTITVQTNANTARYYSACFHTYGTTSYLYAGTAFGSGRINYMTQDGTWAIATVATIIGQYIASGGGRMWASVSNNTVRATTAASDPLVEANWSAAYTVCARGVKITSLGMFGAAPVVGAEDGVYQWIDADQRFDRILPLEFHPDNCPFMKPDSEGNLLTSSADGALIRISRYGGITVARPLSKKSPGRDTPRGRIVDVAVRGEKIYCYLDRGARMTQPSGMKVLYSPDGTAAALEDYSDAARDGRFDTVADISGMTTSSVLLIGCDSKVSAWEFVMNTVSTANARLAWRMVATASGGIPSSVIAIGAVHDGTDTTPGTTSTPLGQTGTFAAKQSVNLYTAGWDLNTIFGYSKYWVAGVLA